MITSWKELPIGMFMDLSKIMRSQISDDEKVFKTAALLKGMEYDEFLNLPIADARQAVADASFLYEEPKAAKTKKTYHLGTRDYKLMRNMDGMTTAQYLNYQGIAGIPPEEGIDELMAIILVPEGKVYGDYDTEEIKEEIRNNLGVEDAYGIANFFTASFEKSMRRIVRYSEAALTAKKWMLRGKDKEKLQAEKIALQTMINELHSMSGFHL